MRVDPARLMFLLLSTCKIYQTNNGIKLPSPFYGVNSPRYAVGQDEVMLLKYEKILPDIKLIVNFPRLQGQACEAAG